MPFTLKNFKEDLEDIGPRFDGAPDLEFRAATKALELEQSIVSYQRVPPGYRFPYGHTWRGYEAGADGLEILERVPELEIWTYGPEAHCNDGVRAELVA